jgi:hypothetical protein
MDSFGSANVALVKKSLNKFLSMGEKATSDDFRMTVEGYSELEFLIQTGQLPPIKREMVEIVGPHGMQVQQQGKIINAHEVPITFIETVSGAVLGVLRDWVKNKRYLTVTLAMLSEGDTQSSKAATVRFENCWIESDAIEFSVEDNTPLKPAATLHVNWVSYFDEDGNTLNWGV